MNFRLWMVPSPGFSQMLTLTVKLKCNCRRQLGETVFFSSFISITSKTQCQIDTHSALLASIGHVAPTTLNVRCDSFWRNQGPDGQGSTWLRLHHRSDHWNPCYDLRIGGGREGIVALKEEDAAETESSEAQARWDFTAASGDGLESSSAKMG